MSAKYNPLSIEQPLYQNWESKGYFQPAGKGEAYCILIPPPNVTGTLHMGHAFQHTLIDSMIRYHRMQGRKTLWQVGTDHAGIATQMLVERQLEKKGINRLALGREKFTEAVWRWRQSSGDDIVQQLRRIGSSVDWSREKFTMDPDYSKAVREAFVQLYRDGLIYRGKRLVNWDPVLGTAISDLEVENQKKQGYLWYIRYPLFDSATAGQQDNRQDYLIVATTRPETMLGDVAVAVHPNDDRYRHLIGKQVQLPIVGRILPVIADDYVDPEFGTGCVKITPAHDFNDYAIGKRHQLPLINVLTAKAAINDNAPKNLRGLDRFKARKAIVDELEASGLLEKTEPHKAMVPKGDRSGAIIEPWLTEQWFMTMKPLAEPAVAAVKEGRIDFIPKNHENTYFSWLRDIQDWCISRQLWWGHRIPAWYDEQGNVYVGRNESEARQYHQLAKDLPLQQEADVLETWFSSGLWSFASLDWPEQPDTMAEYHPSSVLFTGHDIIFFWVARMIMLSLKLHNELPFKEVYVHGLIRDAEGKKMSKSKGNGLDPIDLIDGIDLDSLIAKRTVNLMQPNMVERIEKNTRRDFPNGIPAFGADALRFTFCAMAARGRDIPFDIQRIAGYNHFCNKLWNAANFVFTNTEGLDCGYQNAGAKNTGDMQFDLTDHWIASRFSQCLQAAQQAINSYRFDLLAHELYEFVWHEYCDWYLELAKPTLNNANTPAVRLRSVRHQLLRILEAVLRALHPIVPFITETLWQRCIKLMAISADTIMLHPWPESADFASNEQATHIASMEWLKQMVVGVRTIRAELQVSPARQIELILQGNQQGHSALFEQTAVYIKQLANIATITWLDETAEPPEASVQVVGNLKVLVPLAGLINKDDEIARLKKEINKAENNLLRAQKQLNNASFIAKAPAAVVAERKQKATTVAATLRQLQERLQALNT